jgi:hypothetical protein
MAFNAWFGSRRTTIPRDLARERDQEMASGLEIAVDRRIEFDWRDRYEEIMS